MYSSRFLEKYSPLEDRSYIFFLSGYSHAQYIRLLSLHFQFPGKPEKLAIFLKWTINLNVMAQVCRIAYELMQQHHVDASDRFKSLDDIWWVQLLFWRIICHDASGRQPSIFVLFRYYGGQDEHQQEAVLRHEVEGRSGEVGFSNDLSEPWVYVVPFQISLEVGDVLGVAGNHWNGFNKGRNHRTNRWASNRGYPWGSFITI